MKTPVILVIGRDELIQVSQDKPIEDIGIHDLKLTVSQIEKAQGIIYIDESGNRSVLKDRYGILE